MQRHTCPAPIGAENTFKGIVDLVEMKAYIYYDDIGKDIRCEEIPADMLDKAQEYHEALVEAVAEQDDALLEKYFSGEPLAVDEIKACIRKATIQNRMVPVVCGTSYRNKGVQKLLDAIVDYLPAPTDIPSIKGWTRTPARRLSAIRPTRSRFRRWRLKSRPTLMSVSSVLPRLLRLNQGWRDRLQLQQGHERAFRPHTQMHSNHRQDIECLRWGYRGGRRLTEHQHRGHPLRPQTPGIL